MRRHANIDGTGRPWLLMAGDKLFSLTLFACDGPGCEEPAVAGIVSALTGNIAGHLCPECMGGLMRRAKLIAPLPRNGLHVRRRKKPKAA